jgi:hypothetical protein
MRRLAQSSCIPALREGGELRPEAPVVILLGRAFPSVVARELGRSVSFAAISKYVEQNTDKLKATAGTSYEGVMRLRRADGEFRWHHARCEPLRDQQGRVVQWYGRSVDIDEGKRAEDLLRLSEANLAEALKKDTPIFRGRKRRVHGAKISTVPLA